MLIVLGTVLMLWRDTMIKAIFKRKHSIRGLLKVSEVYSMTIMAGRMAAGRHT